MKEVALLPNTEAYHCSEEFSEINLDFAYTDEEPAMQPAPFMFANLLPNLIWVKSPKHQTYGLYLGRRCLAKVFLQVNMFKGMLLVTDNPGLKHICSMPTTIEGSAAVVEKAKAVVEAAVVAWFTSLTEAGPTS